MPVVIKEVKISASVKGKDNEITLDQIKEIKGLLSNSDSPTTLSFHEKKQIIDECITEVLNKLNEI